MKNGYILLICTVMLLSGCLLDSTLAKSSIGKTYEQLVAAQSSVKSVVADPLDGYEYFCYRCDGQPTRTYTNKAGNQVAVYFYWETYSVPYSCDDNGGCSGGYSFCTMAEQHFEFANGVVISAKWIRGSGSGGAKPYGSNACAGHGPYIEDSERTALPYRAQ